MATYDSAYLLDLFNRLTGRPAADTITNASKYQRLTEAQSEIVKDIASVCPYVLYPTVGYASIPQLTTSDNQTFTFGTDSNGYALAPMGKVGIYQNLNDIPGSPWREGWDYVALGATAIQIPNNGVFSGPLYWRGITPPGDITDVLQPVLFPEGARQLIAYRAAIAFALEGNRNPELGLQLQAQYGRPFGDRPGMFASWLLEWKLAYRNGGALGSNVTGLAVAIGSQRNFYGS